MKDQCAPPPRSSGAGPPPNRGEPGGVPTGEPNGYRPRRPRRTGSTRLRADLRPVLSTSYEDRAAGAAWTRQAQFGVHARTASQRQTKPTTTAGPTRSAPARTQAPRKRARIGM